MRVTMTATKPLILAWRARRTETMGSGERVASCDWRWLRHAEPTGSLGCIATVLARDFIVAGNLIFLGKLKTQEFHSPSQTAFVSTAELKSGASKAQGDLHWPYWMALSCIT